MGQHNRDPASEVVASAERLLPGLYRELHKLATARMAGEGNTVTLQPTSVVHEAWLRLTSSGQPVWRNEAHFFAAAAECMRRIIIDHARQRHALKRGAGAPHVQLELVDVAARTPDEDLLRVDDALERLATVDAEAAELIKLRFYAGLDYKQAAATMGVSERTAKRLWTFGRTWLYGQLTKSEDF